RRCKPGNWFSRPVLISRGLNHPKLFAQRVHCVIHSKRTTTPGHHGRAAGFVPLMVVSVVIAEGKRPVSFRTRKLSPPAPMVLHSGGCGRVGHRRTQRTVEGHPVRGRPA